MNDEQNVLATIPGDIIARASQMLADAETAPDEPHMVDIEYNGRWIRITYKRFKYHHRTTYKRFKYQRHKAPRWFWTAESAEVIS